jgi:hypothetical protein
MMQVTIMIEKITMNTMSMGRWRRGRLADSVFVDGAAAVVEVTRQL